MDGYLATEIAYKNGYEAGKRDALSKVDVSTEKKQYLIDEETLRELLIDSHTINILERDGVDNWCYWMESADEHLIECAGMLPWNEGKSYEDLREMVVGEDYTIEDLANDQIQAFWEEYK